MSMDGYPTRPPTAGPFSAATGQSRGGGFVNGPVAVGDLPAVDASPFEPVDRSYLRMKRLLWVVIMAVIAGLVSAPAWIEGAALWVKVLVAAVPLGIAAGAWVLEGAAFRHRGLQLREHDVSSRQGLIGRRTTTAPFVRVQHVTVERGPLDRLFGVANVVVYTAGAGSADVEIPGLDPERAERLREALISRSAAASAPVATGHAGG